MSITPSKRGMGLLENRIHMYKRSMRQLGKTLQLSGIIDVSVGEPPEKCPESVIASTIHVLKQGDAQGYGPAEGDRLLLSQVARMLKKSYDLDYSPDEILIMPGSRFAIAAAIYATCDSKKPIQITQPFWSGYTEITDLLGVKANTPCPRNGWQATHVTVLDKLSRNTGAILINSPNNPTGCRLSNPNLEGIANEAHKRRIAVISDNAYDRYMRCGFDHTPFAAVSKIAQEQSIEIFSFSKSLALCGWRMAAVAVKDPCVYGIMRKFNGALMTCAPTILQEGIKNGIDDIERFGRLQQMKYQQRADALSVVLETSERIELVPAQGGLFQYVGIRRTGLKSEDFCGDLFKRFSVLAMPGVFFGNDVAGVNRQDDFVRVGLIREPKEMVEVGERIVDYVRSLK